MYGSTQEMMEVHMWLFDWAGVLMWVWKPQFDLAFVQLSTPSPPHSALMQKLQKNWLSVTKVLVIWINDYTLESVGVEI